MAFTQAAVKQIGEYEYSKSTENFLGKGSFGEVWKGRHKVRKTPVAVKKLTGAATAEAVREIELLQSVIHDNLVSVYAWSRDAISIHIVMELCSMDLEKLLERVGHFAGEDMQLVVQQLAKGYNALYNNKILHRDIKPGNILISHISSSEVMLKLADFGCGKMMLDKMYAHSAAGTPLYMAPEVGAICFMNANCRYDYRADFWSLGIVFNQCCGGEFINRPQMFKLFEMAAANSLQLASAVTWPIPQGMDPDLRAIISSLLKPAYASRMTANEFFNHSYVRLGVQKRGITLAAKRIFAVGGRCANGGDGVLQSIDIFDFASKTWRPAVTNLPGSERSALAVVPFRGRLYAFGGYNKGVTEDRVDVYDDVHSTWSSAAKMPTPRWGHSACLFQNGLLVVIGGRNEGVCLSSVNAIDPLKNEWTTMPSMATKRKGLAVVVLGGEIYAIGGNEADSLGERKSLSSVEKFDGVRWSPVASMKNRRRGHCAAVLDDTIFVFGGCDENSKRLKSVESFNVANNEWRIHDSSPMPFGREAASAIAYEGRMYVFGGWNGKAYLNTMDVFNPASSKWETIASKMTTPRAFAGSVLM